MTGARMEVKENWFSAYGVQTLHIVYRLCRRYDFVPSCDQ
jgi:hypothetical protein